jgi:molecular chaperone DnaK
MKDILCGIDLGTTNSSIAYLQDGKPTVIDIEEGSGIVPSVVSLDEDTQQFLVGRVAKNRLAVFPDHTVRSIKRLMGKETRVSLGKQTFSPEEISSFILKYLVERASEKLGQEIRETVITVPAYFNDAQRRATIKSGELAGLIVTRIINEPTAASLVYDHVALGTESTSPHILVYDLGGGTLDVSILKINGEIKEVLASCGDTALGGDDFDERLVSFFLRQFKERTGIDLSFTDRALHVRLREIAERTKIALSDAPYVRVKEIALTTVQGEPFNLDIEIQRHDYEEMIRDLVQRTIDKVHEAFKEAHLLRDDIGKVILVGGATRTPLVMSMLAEMFDHPIYHSVDPDLCVAMGASVQKGLIAGEPLGHILLDVTAHSLGVKTADAWDEDSGDADYFSTIIRRNTKVPVRKAEVYYTMFESQDGVDVEVYQGESRSCRENTRIGRFFYALKPSPPGSPVVAEFAYDKEGIVHITVAQKGYSNRKEVTLDVRTKTILEDQEEVREQKILNYIIQKSRRLTGDGRLAPDLREELEMLTEQYEEALKSGEDDRLIDQSEDRLLEKMEEAEERLKGLE